ncbi:hypothetical protein E4T43_01432 [Aureobasidium subglaciale]|nr:hypothetical protein E4T43_01432 [Aureobasidium subglaciale]
MTLHTVFEQLRTRAKSAKTSRRAKRHTDGWVLPKQSTSFAPEGTWTNVDLDVTPLERRTWTPLSILGYWINDIVSSLYLRILQPRAIADLHSVASLIGFMDSLGMFLAPIIGVSIADYWIVKRRRIDVAALYRPEVRYHYAGGVNWRAILAMACSIGPAIPCLAHNITPSLDIGGAQYVSDLVWYYGSIVAFAVYIAVSKVWPATENLVDKYLLSENPNLDVRVVSDFHPSSREARPRTPALGNPGDSTGISRSAHVTVAQIFTSYSSLWVLLMC